jgi:hypothetical protein
MSSSTWRVLSGYATYQRTPIRMISCGKWAPLKLITMVALPLGVLDHLSGRAYLKCVPNETCDRTPVDAQEPPDHAAYFVLRDGVPTLCCEQHRFYPREPLPFPGVSARR